MYKVHLQYTCNCNHIKPSFVISSIRNMMFYVKLVNKKVKCQYSLCRDHKDLVESVDLQDQMDSVEILDSVESQDLPDLQDREENQDLLDHLALLDHLDLLENLDHLDHQVC